MRPLGTPPDDSGPLQYPHPHPHNDGQHEASQLHATVTPSWLRHPILMRRVISTDQHEAYQLLQDRLARLQARDDALERDAAGARIGGRVVSHIGARRGGWWSHQRAPRRMVVTSARSAAWL